MKQITKIILPANKTSLVIETKKTKKKKDSCCEKFKKKGKGCCKSCPISWG